MWYWNKTNFEGLEVIAELMAQEPELHLYSKYCEWRTKGVRKKALHAISEFANEAALWDFEKRKGFTDWLLTLQINNSGIHQLIPFQVSKQIIEPTLKEWIQIIPEDVKAQRWFGIVFKNREALKKATNIAPDELLARQTLIDWLSYDLWFATHHLPNYFIGDPQELDTAIAQVDKLLKELPQSEYQAELFKEHKQQVQLISDWKSFKAEGHNDFEQWCAQQGKSYAWMETVFTK